MMCDAAVDTVEDSIRVLVMEGVGDRLEDVTDGDDGERVGGTKRDEEVTLDE